MASFDYGIIWNSICRGSNIRQSHLLSWSEFFFFGTILLPYSFFLQKEDVLIVYRECLNFLVNKMNSPNRYYWWISWRIVKQLLENSDQKCWWLCLIAFKFPETANDKLPETIHDALQLGQNVKRNKFGVITSVWWSPENTKILFMYL